jgi:sterol desaturase/sphingolipid hydroxylase (fatty acid hydroxylase superfamily)
VPGWADDLGWWQVALLGVVVNVATVASSVALWHVVVAQRALRGRARAVVRRDRVLAGSTIAVNSAALVAGWWAWQEGLVELVDPSLPRTAIEVAYLFVGLETIMYAVHRTFHLDPLYGWFHAVHHTGDEQMGPLTLFVMHPLEPAGFALAMLVLLVAWPVSVAAVVVFYGINLVVGTVAHVPSPPSAAAPAVLGGAALHQGHHAAPRTNYGFFTTFWDRVLGTR